MNTKTSLASAYKPAWAHHPRGGRIEGIAGKLKKGLYGPERVIARTIEDAKNGLGYSIPASQCFKIEQNKPIIET